MLGNNIFCRWYVLTTGLGDMALLCDVKDWEVQRCVEGYIYRVGFGARSAGFFSEAGSRQGVEETWRA